jgi:HK97 family phage portal protein
VSFTTTLKNALTSIFTKHPTLKADYSAYAEGSGKSFDEEYNDFIRNVETIERIIRLHANVFSMMKPMIMKQDTKGNLTPMKVKNIDLDFFNEADTRVDFFRKLAVSLYSQGAAIIVGESTKGKLNFYSIDVARVKITTSKIKLIENFVYTGSDGSDIIYKPSDCIYINDSVDPSNLIYSLSRLQPLNDVILLQANIINKAKESISGGAKDSFIVSAEAPMSKDTQDLVKRRFDSFMQSAGASSLLLNTKLNVHQVGNTMSGADMLSFFNQVNQLMIEHFNIPPALLGDYSASGANKNEELIYSLRVWFTTMVRPIMTNIELNFTRYLRETLGLKNAIFKFNLDEVDMLDDPIDTKVDRAIKLHKSGMMSFNEARALVELPPIESPSADLHFLPQFLTGSAPISLENFDTEVERLLQTGSTRPTEPISDASGNSGDEDNTNVITDSRGGKQGE